MPANRGRRRVSEAALFWISALGGWPGGFLGMVSFQHKSAKVSFRLKFAAAFCAWAGLVYAIWRIVGGNARDFPTSRCAVARLVEVNAHAAQALQSGGAHAGAALADAAGED